MSKCMKVILLSLTALLFSCQTKEKGIALSNTGSSIEELTPKILNDGDLAAYNELSQNFFDSPDNCFLYTALLTANKYKHPPAFLDVYYCLTDLTHKKENTELDNLDAKTRDLALRYLIDGAGLGEKNCMEILGKHF